jgi:hypothetical protein
LRSDAEIMPRIAGISLAATARSRRSMVSKEGMPVTSLEGRGAFTPGLVPAVEGVGGFGGISFMPYASSLRPLRSRNEGRGS